MGRAENQTELEVLNGNFSSAKLAVCANFRGLTVEQLSAFRNQLRKDGASSRVVKNTLAKISCREILKDDDQSEVEKFLKLFAGPNYVIFAKDDPITPAKTIAKYAKDFEKLEIKGGWFDGRFVDQKAVGDLSKMASKEESLSKLLNLMQTPATQVVRMLNAPGQKLVQVLEAWRAKLEEQSK